VIGIAIRQIQHIEIGQIHVASEQFKFAAWHFADFQLLISG
jgi:hypothetical protein